jgi:hypothetical protein
MLPCPYCASGYLRVAEIGDESSLCHCSNCGWIGLKAVKQRNAIDDSRQHMTLAKNLGLMRKTVSALLTTPLTPNR